MRKLMTTSTSQPFNGIVFEFKQRNSVSRWKFVKLKVMIINFREIFLISMLSSFISGSVYSDFHLGTPARGFCLHFFRGKNNYP